MFTGYWIVPYKIDVCFCWPEVLKRNKRSKGVKKGVHVHVYGDKLFIVHLFLWGFFYCIFFLIDSFRSSAAVFLLSLNGLWQNHVIYLQLTGLMWRNATPFGNRVVNKYGSVCHYYRSADLLSHGDTIVQQRFFTWRDVDRKCWNYVLGNDTFTEDNLFLYIIIYHGVTIIFLKISTAIFLVTRPYMVSRTHTYNK